MTVARKNDRQRKLEIAGQSRLGLPDYRSYYKPPDYALPACDWKPPRAHELPSWKGVKRIGLDCEAKDEDLKRLGPGIRRPGNRLAGVSFKIEDGPGFYLPVAHEGGDNCDWDVMSYLRDQLRDFDGVIVGANIGYDADWLEEHGCDILSKRLFDVQTADALLWELHLKYSLQSICDRRGLPGKDEGMLREAASAYKIDPKKELWRLPARFVARYAITDASVVLPVARQQERDIEDEDIEGIWDVERRVTPILVKMRRRGVRIDTKHLAFVHDECLRVETECMARVRSLTGIRLNADDVMNSNAVAMVLRAAGIDVPTTESYTKSGKRKVQFSITNEWLSTMGEIGEVIARSRQWFRLRRTFCAQVDEALVGDRVHCTFNQMKTTDDEGEGKGVRYGRLSSSTFNIQQQPIRHEEFGPMWRQVFVPDYGMVWMCADWSQQEPRIAVHYAELLKLPGAKEFADEYRANPALDIHQKLADISGHPRSQVKNQVNGRLYAMGDVSLCRKLGLETVMGTRRGFPCEVPGPEAQRLIDEFHRFAPWIKGLTGAASARAKEVGYVKTILGRKLHFERMPSGEIWKAHKAFNRVGQGSAADQCKATMVRADEAGIPLQMQVHDEFDLSDHPDHRYGLELKQYMLDTVKFNVPSKVDLETGDSWGNLTKV